MGLGTDLDTGEPVFGSVLIANRGEIALRIIRTCDRLGISTIAVYTPADREAPHVPAADTAFAVDDYLNLEQVLAVARQSGADAIHPGYGFLSERADFAHAVEDTPGVVLVGPSAEAMQAMGRKDRAREIALAAGVPVVPAHAATDPVDLLTFPVLVKAAAGGGGKGMRIVHGPAEYADAVAGARREARAAFGDDDLLVEKYVAHGRHLEVQVLADQHGTVLHLFERDCSTQRRHQKVLEEAPGPTVPVELRDQLTSAAIRLAREVGYTGAGTVEFLLDVDTGEFYFLEMNTRLQVEHPVTEAITGLDLVEQQLRVAAGARLSIRQDELRIRGHAIEARVYAEDPYRDFLPQAGRATWVRWPAAARVDHALHTGQVVSTSYDPLLGKVIAHGPDRESARRALVAALEDTAILGLTTNVGFLRDLLASDEFAAAQIDTAWLDSARGQAPPPPDPTLARVFAAWAQATRAAGTEPVGSPWAGDGFRLGSAPAPQDVALDHVARVDLTAGRVDDVAVVALPAEPPSVALEVAGRRETAVVQCTPYRIEVVHAGHRHVFERPDLVADPAAVAGDGTVLAPMPGTVLEVRVVPGQQVVSGQVLVIMEAMKMELTLRAPFDGEVVEALARPASQVALGARLFVVQPEPTP